MRQFSERRIVRTQRYPALAAISDQGIYAGTNLLMVISVARSVSPAEFGQFSAVYLGVVLALAASRARFGQPLLYSARSNDGDLRNLLAMSGVMAIALVVCSTLLGSVPAAITAAAIPLLAYQDRIRYRCFGSARPALALGSDASWLLVQASALVVLHFRWGVHPSTAVGAWALGAVVASGWGRTASRKLSELPHDAETSTTISVRRIQRAFLADACIAFGRNQGFVLVFATLSSWNASGAMRLCFSLLGFVPVISQGLISAYVPKIVGSVSDSNESAGTARILQLICLITGGAGLLIVLTAEHFSILDLVFGTEAWSVARPLFFWVALLHLGFIVEAPLHVLLMSYVGLPFTVRRKAVSAVIHLAFAAGGLLLSSSATGGVIGMVVAEVAVLIMWQAAWRRRSPQTALCERIRPAAGDA